MKDLFDFFTATTPEDMWSHLNQRANFHTALKSAFIYVTKSLSPWIHTHTHNIRGVDVNEILNDM